MTVEWSWASFGVTLLKTLGPVLRSPFTLASLLGVWAPAKLITVCHGVGALRACVGPGGTLVPCRSPGPWRIQIGHRANGSLSEDDQSVPMAVLTTVTRSRWGYTSLPDMAEGYPEEVQKTRGGGARGVPWLLAAPRLTSR